MGVHSVLMRLFSIYSIFLVVYIPTVIKKRWGSGQWLHPCDREALGFYVFGSAREISFKFLHSKSMVLVSTAVFSYFFGLRFLVFMSKRGVLLVFDLDLNPRRLFFSFFFFYFSFSFSLFCFIFNFFSALY